MVPGVGSSGALAGSSAAGRDADRVAEGVGHHQLAQPPGHVLRRPDVTGAQVERRPLGYPPGRRRRRRRSGAAAVSPPPRRSTCSRCSSAPSRTRMRRRGARAPRRPRGSRGSGRTGATRRGRPSEDRDRGPGHQSTAYPSSPSPLPRLVPVRLARQFEHLLARPGRRAGSGSTLIWLTTPPATSDSSAQTRWGRSMRFMVEQ